MVGIQTSKTRFAFDKDKPRNLDFFDFGLRLWTGTRARQKEIVF